MAVSNDVELSMLQTCFHLQSYDYLCKLPEDETYDQLAMEGGGKVEDDLKGLDIEDEKEEVVEKVVEANVRRSVQRIRDESAVLNDLEDDGAILIVGAVYDIETGKVRFLD